MKNVTHLRLALTFVACVALTPRDAFAIDPGACCAAQSSRVDALMNPVVGGDERFFAASGSPTTVMFLVGTYQSMRDYVLPLPIANAGCSNATDLTNMAAIYDKADLLKNGLTPIDADTSLTHTFFEPTKFYASSTTRMLEGGAGFFSFSTSDHDDVRAIGTDAASACTAVPGITAGEITTCTACMTTGPGWYRRTAGSILLNGGVLNMNPPKFVITRAVVKEVAGSLSSVRIGLAAFSPGTGDMYDPPRIPVLAKPACTNLSPIDSAAVLTAVKAGINNLPFTGSERQIGEALFGVGAYFSTKAQWKAWFDNMAGSADYPRGSGWGAIGNTGWTENTFSNSPGTNGTFIWGAGEEMCSDCQQTMVIVLTDGSPNNDNSVPMNKMMSLLTTQGAIRPDGTTLTFNPGSSGACPNPTAAGGINFCDRFSSTKCACDSTGGVRGSDNGNMDFMDDVAFFLANTDLRPDRPGKQTVKTYTIGLGDNSPMLQSIAYAGGGVFYSASNASQLKSSVIAAITDVQSKTTGFSGASVAAVQTGSSEAILPRLFPRADKPWLGSLWRFEMYNEFVEGVSITDGGLNNVLMIDDAGVAVTEDLVAGSFVKTGSAVQADEFWEAGKKLVALGHAHRNLWTIQDTSGDGAFTSDDTLLEVSIANRATLAQYLGVLGTPFCPVAAGSEGTLLSKFNLSATALATVINAAYAGTVVATPSTQAELDALCVAGLILYIRGADLADEDADNNRGETRRSVLADIFHSTPVTVEPPVDSYLCELGIINQCARTLFSTTGVENPTPLAPYAELDCDSPPAARARNAYDSWAYSNRKRQKAVLVGSNDGVLHAFDNGTATEACPSGNSTVTYNAGTGRELWGFIPPDQLSRLQDQFLGHTYGMDGDVMVRDVWADGSGTPATVNGIKENDEFHTVAIAAEGRGGTHYVALELEYDGSGNVEDHPRFLWMFPQPCSPEAALFGKTLYSLAPKAPPIGPVLIEATTTGARLRYGAQTAETWVAALSGGWSPGRERGRGVYVVDAYRGQVNGRRDNLLWKFEFEESASGDLEPAKKLGMSVAAPIAMVDYGTNAEPRQDGFFDTAIFGDVQGQLWVARMQQPAEVDTSAPYLATNWRAGRAFEMDRDSVPDDPGADPDGDSDDDADKRKSNNRHPFYYLPSVVIEPGTNVLRAFIGSGERYSILDNPNPVCRFDNPQACAKMQCNDVKIRYRLDSPGVDISRLETRYKKRQFAAGKSDYSPQSDAFCGTAGSDNVRAWFDHYKVNGCRGTDAVDYSRGTLNDSDVRCRQNSDATSYSCNYSASPTIKTEELLSQATTDVSNLGRNRYYGVAVYGGTRVFNEGDDSATAFDGARLTDRPVGELIDVTTTTCTGPGLCSGPLANANGWFLDYDVQATKTATGSAIISSCVLWNTLTPAAGSGSSCAAGAGSPEARLVQSNFLTGAPDCAEAFLDGGVSARSLSRNVVAPPPEPATSIQVSKSGQVRYSAMLVEPGQTTSINVTSGQDVLQLVYEIPVSRALHQCRHDDGGCVVMP